MSDERKCGKCGEPYSRMGENETLRVYSCDDGCGAYEAITKGKTSWWYHGAKMPDEMPAPWLEKLCTVLDNNTVLDNRSGK